MASVSIPLGGKYQSHAVRFDEDMSDVARSHRWLGLKPQRSRTMYARSSVNGDHLYAHHLVIGKPPKGFVVDHINGDGLDNRRSNLRFITHSENIQQAHDRQQFREAKNSTGGIQIVHKRLADGTMKTYKYDRKNRGAA